MTMTLRLTAAATLATIAVVALRWQMPLLGVLLAAVLGVLAIAAMARRTPAARLTLLLSTLAVLAALLG